MDSAQVGPVHQCFAADGLAWEAATGSAGNRRRLRSRLKAAGRNDPLRLKHKPTGPLTATDQGARPKGHCASELADRSRTPFGGIHFLVRRRNPSVGRRR